MNAFLASVRTLHEAELAVAGGGDWLDLKEPARGALGRAPDAVIRVVVGAYSGHLPISATIGDCWQTPEDIPAIAQAVATLGVDYVKVGLMAQNAGRATLQAIARAVEVVPALIAVCFAESMPTAHDIDALAACGVRGVMLDTADKSRGSLLTLVAFDECSAFVSAVRQHHLLVGLAGSLRPSDIPEMAVLGADYLGFRGALCAAAQRTDALTLAGVQHVRRCLDAVNGNLQRNAASVGDVVSHQTAKQAERKNYGLA